MFYVSQEAMDCSTFWTALIIGRLVGGGQARAFCVAGIRRGEDRAQGRRRHGFWGRLPIRPRRLPLPEGRSKNWVDVPPRSIQEPGESVTVKAPSRRALLPPGGIARRGALSRDGGKGIPGGSGTAPLSHGTAGVV